MRKVWVIAVREYSVAVRSKAFIITMVLMPILMSASLGMQILFKRLEDTKEKRYVVIDRTGGDLAKVLHTSADLFNQTVAPEPDSKRPSAARILLEVVPPGDNDPESIARQRFEQSQRVDHDAVEGILDIGAAVFKMHGDQPTTDDEAVIRFQAKKPNQRVFIAWAEQSLNAGIQAKRFASQNINPKLIALLQEPVTVKQKALTRQNADGSYVDTSESTQIANFVLPAVLIGLMFMVIMIGATPAMQGIVEEKSQRIAEVLLGSVPPFQLMAGKLLGVIGVSLTMASVYLIGGYGVADRLGVTEMLSPALLGWFVLFLIMALLIFGSLFIAIGAAAGDIKDTQTLLMPVMVIACLPFFALGPIMQDPNGKIAVVCSFFPFATPMLLVARQSVPPGVPLWQMISGIALVLTTTLVCVWAAGRIFRVGILMQGKGARFTDLIKWVRRG